MGVKDRIKMYCRKKKFSLNEKNFRKKINLRTQLGIGFLDCYTHGGYKAPRDRLF